MASNAGMRRMTSQMKKPTASSDGCSSEEGRPSPQCLAVGLYDTVPVTADSIMSIQLSRQEGLPPDNCVSCVLVGLPPEGYPPR